MNDPYDPSTRGPIVIAAACSLVLLAVFCVIRSLGGGSGTEGNFPILGLSCSGSARPAPASPDAGSNRAARHRPTASAGAAVSQGFASGAQPNPRVGREAWELVAQLEMLAKTPASFHAAALPLVERLTELCSRDVNDDRVDDAGRGIAQELHFAIVLDPTETTLVRGAIFLSLATLLSEADFWSTFDAWYSGDPGFPLELIRTAALAATRIGSPSPCKHALELENLAALGKGKDSARPGFYPLTLERIAPARACAAIRRWLDSGARGRELLRAGSGSPSPSADTAAASDDFVTAEILFCVWGQQSLRSPEVELAVLQEALLQDLESPGHDRMCARAANFLVCSLAMCSKAFLGAAAEIGSSSDPVLAAMARSMQGPTGDGLAITSVARLESLRFSEDANDHSDLIVMLTRIGERFGRSHATDLEQRTVALDYLGGLVADIGVAESARACALMAIARDGSWPAIQRAANLGLRQGSHSLLSAIALDALVAHARSNPARRSEVLEMLRQYSKQGPPRQMRQAVDQCVAELTR